MPAPGHRNRRDRRPPADDAGQETAAKLLVRCLENEGVEFIFGIPGEENIDVMDALLDSPIKFVTDAPRAGRGVHGRRLRPPDRPRRRVHVHARARARPT